MNKIYDVIVIGGGHAGCEAALASSRMGCSTLLLTMNLDSIALMPCNPAIGGIAKGHIVREIDALGGEMGRCIDAAGIQFRMLNTSNGPAVQALRAQADKQQYRLRMKATLEHEKRLMVAQGTVEEILTDDNAVTGVKTNIGIIYQGKAVIIATGTFLKGKIHIGMKSFSAGRAGEFASEGLSDSLTSLGLTLGRLKTGTCPRLDAKTIDFSNLERQDGDPVPQSFSHTSERLTQIQLPCYITYTNSETHNIIKGGLDRSPLYSGKITGIGPRYCPSIEDKVVRFPDKVRHQIFLEPEGRDTTEIYANGVSTSLPPDVQIRFLRTIKGLEGVEIMRPGYAVEYDFVPPTQLFPTLETKKIKNLYHAGQINGTSGYEEAGAQGLMAGINAALRVSGKGDDFILQRSEGYIGVLIDDLVTKGTNEPYRMFTSRAEYRLLLRHDNADLRLMEKGYKAGLLHEHIYKRLNKRRGEISSGISFLKGKIVTPTEETNKLLEESGIGKINTAASLADLLRRTGVSYDNIISIFNGYALEEDIKRQVEIEIKYEGYITRQRTEIEKIRRLEEKRLPKDIDYKKVSGLSNEVREKLISVMPASVGQAARIPGVTPSAISILLIYMEKWGRGKGD